MDILRKELDSIYHAQHLEHEHLDAATVSEIRKQAKTLAHIGNACSVVTDASCDRCYVYSGSLGRLMGFTDGESMSEEVNSSDEDMIYNRIHPEDLVDKRMLEYEFFKMIHTLRADEKLHYKATCQIRMKDRHGVYRRISNSTQIIALSPHGGIWLILCCYDLSPFLWTDDGIAPHIINNSSGEILSLSFRERRQHILTAREKEILCLIREGKPSKQIADMLGISIHTVNRHRQNIIEKLSVSNSIEAVTAASIMNLI